VPVREWQTPGHEIQLWLLNILAYLPFIVVPILVLFQLAYHFSLRQRGVIFLVCFYAAISFAGGALFGFLGQIGHVLGTFYPPERKVMYEVLLRVMLWNGLECARIGVIIGLSASLCIDIIGRLRRRHD
jgi:hypothetical protein